MFTVGVDPNWQQDKLARLMQALELAKARREKKKQVEEAKAGQRFQLILSAAEKNPNALETARTASGRDRRRRENAAAVRAHSRHAVRRTDGRRASALGPWGNQQKALGACLRAPQRGALLARRGARVADCALESFPNVVTSVWSLPEIFSTSLPASLMALFPPLRPRPTLIERRKTIEIDVD